MTVETKFVVLDLETIPDPRWTAPEPDAFPPPWAHRIVCVGFLALDHDLMPMRSGTLAGEEPDILRGLAKAMDRQPTVITFNGRTFDLPVIMQRSLSHRVQQRWYYENRDYRYRFSALGHIDVRDELEDYGAARGGTLDAFAKLIGLHGKAGVDGSKVADLFAAGQLDAIRSYCLDDVRQTAILFLAMWHLRGNLKLEELDERWAAVEKHFAERKAA